MRPIKLAVLAIFLLAMSACSRSTPPPTLEIDPSAPPPPIVSNAQTSETTPVRGIHQPINFDNRTITIGLLQEGATPFTMLPPAHMEPDPATSENYIRDRLIWDNARRVEHDFNFTLEEWVSRGSAHFAGQLRTSVLAGSAITDLIFAPPNILFEAVLGGQMQPLCQINLPCSDLLGNQFFSRFVAEGFGYAWAFHTTEPDTSAFTLGVNLDVINAAGAPNPVELYNNNQWTWDAMLNIMRMTTLETAGEQTQWGIIGRPCELLRNFIGANDGVIVTEDYRFGFDHPNTLEALEFIETIMGEQLWMWDTYVTFYGNGGSSMISRWSDFQSGNFAFKTGLHWSLSSPDDIPFDFAVIPLPAGPSNTSGSTSGGGWQTGVAFPRAASIEAVHLLMIMEEYFSWSVNEPERLHDMAITWGRGIVLTEDNAARHVYAATGQRFDMGNNIAAFDNILDEMVRYFMPHNDQWRDRRTSVEVIEIYRDQVQRELERIFQ